MEAITTIGLDIAKSVFQVHGVDADGNVVIRLVSSSDAMYWRSSRSCRRAWSALKPALVASLVARTPGARPHRTLDAAGLCEALRQAP